MPKRLDSQLQCSWRLVGSEWESECCKGRKEKIVAYYSGGIIRYKCECGKYRNEDPRQRCNSLA